MRYNLHTDQGLGAEKSSAAGFLAFARVLELRHWLESMQGWGSGVGYVGFRHGLNFRDGIGFIRAI